MDLERLFTIALSADGAKATLTLLECNPPPARQNVALPAMNKAIATAAALRKITAPLEQPLIRAALTLWLQNGKKRDAILAKARPAVPGRDARVTLFHGQPEHGAQKDIGRVDKRNQSFVHNVEQGGVLARIVPATRGEAGQSVTGTEVRAPDGKVAAPAVNPNVLVETGPDEVVYRSKITGIVLELTEQKMEVGTQIEIRRDVDHVTGNIDAWGDVIVRGSIEQGFSVRARGNVTVTGTCESAFIQSGGDVEIGGGLLGRSGLTEVKAKGSVKAFFVENAKVEAGGDVYVRDSVLNSRILCKGLIDVGGRGTVLASYLAAVRSVAASVFGSEARLPVELVVGADPLAWRQLARLRRLLRFTRRTTLKGAQVRLGHVSTRQARADADRRGKLRREAMQTDRLVLRREHALSATLLDGGGPAVEIRREASPKMRVQLGPLVYDVLQPGLRAGVLQIDTARGEIVFVPAAQEVKGGR